MQGDNKTVHSLDDWGFSLRIKPGSVTVPSDWGKRGQGSGGSAKENYRGELVDRTTGRCEGFKTRVPWGTGK